MNPGITDDGSITYYDSDYPSVDDQVMPDDVNTRLLGIDQDLPLFKTLASRFPGPVLELCCGTGRVLLPLARAGHRVVGVDLNPKFLDILRSRVAQEPAEIQARVELLEQDVTRLELGDRRFGVAFMIFNSLLFMVDFEAQCTALAMLARHMRPGGMVVLDVLNPMIVKPQGNPTPQPFYSRINPHTGNRYTRFAMLGPVDANQRQRLYGWYDEIDPQGVVRRQDYSFHMRLVYRFELQLMLERAGFHIASLEGGLNGEPFTPHSRRMLVQARYA